MRHDLFQSLARFVVAAWIVATAAVCVVPLLAVVTGAYASSPTGAGATSRLLLLFLPQAVAVALPIATALAVFFVCRRLPVTRQVCIAVGALTIATALVTAALNVSVAPVRTRCIANWPSAMLKADLSTVGVSTVALSAPDESALI